MRGGFRPGAGLDRKKTVKKSKIPKDIRKDARAAGMQPLQYMLAVMNDPEADETRRDRMAIAAAPYCHGRVADQRVGKKDAEQEAARSAGGVGTDWAGDLDFEIRPN